MTEREQIIQYLRSVAAGFDPEQDVLTDVLDSVSLLQLVLHIDEEFGVPLDLGNLTLDDFRNVDSLLGAMQAHRATG